MSSRSSPYYAVKVLQTLKKSQFLHFFGVLTPYGGPQRDLGSPVRVRPKNGKKLRISPLSSNLSPNRFRSVTTLLSCVLPDTCFVIKVRQLLKKRNFWDFWKIFVRGPPVRNRNRLSPLRKPEKPEIRFLIVFRLQIVFYRWNIVNEHSPTSETWSEHVRNMFWTI